MTQMHFRFKVSQQVLGYTLSTQPLWCKVLVLQAITGKDARQAAEDVRSLCSSYLEVDGVLVHFRFHGRGQRDTPAVDVRGIVEIVMLLPGRLRKFEKKIASPEPSKSMGFWRDPAPFRRLGAPPAIDTQIP